MHKALKSRTRKHKHVVKIGSYVLFYREKDGYKGPGKITKVLNNVYTIEFEGRLYTSSYERLKPVNLPPPECFRSKNLYISSSDDDEPSESSDQNNNMTPDHAIGQSHAEQEQVDLSANDTETTQEDRILPTENLEQPSDMPHTPPSDHTIENPLGEIMDLYQKLLEDNEAQLSMHYTTRLKEFYSTSKHATAEEFEASYQQEFDSWLKKEAFEVIDAKDLPPNPNIIPSHVIFKWKEQNTPHQRLKARIAPNGNQDNEKENQKTDSPSIKPELMKLIVSYASENGYDICLADIETAFLQSEGINREIYVKPPRESKSRSRIIGNY